MIHVAATAWVLKDTFALQLAVIQEILDSMDFFFSNCEVIQTNQEFAYTRSL